MFNFLLVMLTMGVLIIFVVLLPEGFLLLLLLHVSYYTWSDRIRGRGSMVEGGTHGNRSMSINDLAQLPCYDYVANDSASNPVICAICLENLTMGDKCRLLPICNHSFHAKCVDTWLLERPFCPICRSSANSHSGNQVVL